MQVIIQKHSCNCKQCTKELQGNLNLKKDIFLEKISKEFPQNDFYKFVNEIPDIIQTKDSIPVWCNKHQVKFYKNLEIILYRHSCNCEQCYKEIKSNKSIQYYINKNKNILTDLTTHPYIQKLKKLYPHNDFEIFINELQNIPISAKTKIPVLCKKHNIKFYKMYKHAGYTPFTCFCPKCIQEKNIQNKKTLADVIEDLKVYIHDDITYEHVDLSIGTNYDNKTKLTLTCPKHGDFITTLGSRRCKSGCKLCYKERQHAGVCLTPEHRITTEMWIERFKNEYGNLYDYSLIKEIPNQLTKLPIICLEHRYILSKCK